uniref:Uncharacterized protein n=1 Tax=Rhizophora mucronata TaxID=61149 RepID=A0A2P2LP24_RHIMU
MLHFYSLLCFFTFFLFCVLTTRERVPLSNNTY